MTKYKLKYVEEAMKDIGKGTSHDINAVMKRRNWTPNEISGYCNYSAKIKSTGKKRNGVVVWKYVG